MKSILLFVCFVTVILAVGHTHFSPEIAHDAVLNLPCCNSYGGVLCGYLWKTCCLGRCNNWLIAQTCGGQALDLRPEHCGNSCLNQCGAMGGIICGTSILRDQCCQPQFCQGLTGLTRTCLPGTRIPIGNCAPNTVVV